MYIGIDLGGTKIELAAFNENDRLLYTERLLTPRNCYQETLRTIALLVHRAEARFGRALSIGIGIPGAFSRVTGKVKNAPSTPLQGQKFSIDISHLLDRFVFVGNDADCFTFSEATTGAAVGGRVVFGVILGTGVGGGIVINNTLINGPNGIAGEWGHNSMLGSWSKNGKALFCVCGGINHIESWVSGPAFASAYNEMGGEKLDAAAIIQRFRDGELLAHRCFNRYVDCLANALASIINLLDPDVIVLGGGMSNVSELYQLVPMRWQQYIFSDDVLTRLVPPMHGDASGARGAAKLGLINASEYSVR